MIKGLIFDLDGVLVDTVDYHYASWVKLAKSLGFDLNISIKEKLKGISRMDSLKLVLQQGDIKSTEKQRIIYAKQKNNWYLESLKNIDDGVVLPGVKQFLQSVAKAGIKMTVGSASKNAKRILAKTSINKGFLRIVDGTDVKNAKPDPEVFQIAAKAMGLSPRECIVFEDSYKGLEAANRGQFRSLGIGHINNLYNAEFIIPNLKNVEASEILEIFNNH